MMYMVKVSSNTSDAIKPATRDLSNNNRALITISDNGKRMKSREANGLVTGEPAKDLKNE